jgi:RNA polymerase sigma-70 factor, ECF subfamily
VTDPELLQRCRDGDQVAWQELVSRHAGRVYALAWRFLGSRPEAEDVTQEVFVRVYQGLGQRGDGSFAGWLHTVARNVAIDRYRRTREERRRRVPDVQVLATAAANDPDPSELLEQEQLRARLYAAVAALPVELREPIVLCDLQGLPYEDAALVLGVPLGTLKSRLNRARLELARRVRSRQERRA